MNLEQATVGGRFHIIDIARDNHGLHSRLYALGLYPGAAIEVLRRAPLGDPLQVKVGQTLLSIRCREAQAITVEAA